MYERIIKLFYFYYYYACEMSSDWSQVKFDTEKTSNNNLQQFAFFLFFFFFLLFMNRYRNSWIYIILRDIMSHILVSIHKWFASPTKENPLCDISKRDFEWTNERKKDNFVNLVQSDLFINGNWRNKEPPRIYFISNNTM